MRAFYDGHAFIFTDDDGTQHVGDVCELRPAMTGVEIAHAVEAMCRIEKACPGETLSRAAISAAFPFTDPRALLGSALTDEEASDRDRYLLALAMGDDLPMTNEEHFFAVQTGIDRALARAVDHAHAHDYGAASDAAYEALTLAGMDSWHGVTITPGDAPTRAGDVLHVPGLRWALAKAWLAQALGFLILLALAGLFVWAMLSRDPMLHRGF